MNLVMPAAHASRIRRPQRCENCGHHGIMDDGKTPDCRFDPPKMMLLPMPNGQAQLNSMFPMTRPEWHCGKWKPLVEQTASLEAAK